MESATHLLEGLEAIGIGARTASSYRSTSSYRSVSPGRDSTGRGSVASDASNELR